MSKTKITVKCPSCGKEFSKEFDTVKIVRVMNGELVQDVFPELSADDRELFFISHICPTCWNNIFAEVDEEMEEWLNENDQKPFPNDVPQKDIDKYIEEKIELSAKEFADSK